MEKLAEFVAQHIGEDTSRLLLGRAKWPDIDMDMAVSCIESRRKLKGKVQEWYDEPRLVFPVKLSAEQCSSSATGRYKAKLAERIAGAGCRIADLTGGLGVDSWFFSQKAAAVLYNEMQKPLCDAARHNFAVLKASNITISNCAVGHEGDASSASPRELLADFRPDIVYMDPARRGEGGRKVFLIEECTPDVLTLKDEISVYSRHILLKLSPMADISMVCSRLGKTCREVHVVASGGECKELLIWMDREWQGEYGITAVEMHNDGTCGTFIFKPSEEKEAAGIPCCRPYCVPGGKTAFLFEPGKALMKAGAFNIISQRLGISKLGKSTHYYIVPADQTSEIMSELKRTGKVYSIIRCEPLDKRTIKAAGEEFPYADVTARNIPMDTDTLRKKLGQKTARKASRSSELPIHIFALKSDTEGNLLLITRRCAQEESSGPLL